MNEVEGIRCPICATELSDDGLAAEGVSALCAEIKRLQAENSKLTDLWQNSERAYQHLITHWQAEDLHIWIAEAEQGRYEIKRLREEVERLRKALLAISNVEPDDPYDMAIVEARIIARAALDPESVQHDARP